MSWKATAFVKPITHYPDGTKLRAAEKLLLFVLADDYNDSKGCAWPSQKTLAEHSLLSVRQVRRLLAKICSKGWPISVEKNGKSSHRYRFLLEDKMSGPSTDKLSLRRTQLCPVIEDTAMSSELTLNRHLEPQNTTPQKRRRLSPMQEIRLHRQRQDEEIRKELAVGSGPR